MTLNSSTPYLANGEDAADADAPDSGGYVYFDAAAHTLFLNNASITGAANGTNNYGIYAEGDLNIVLAGSNTLSAGDATTGFTGSRGDSKGIYVRNGGILIQLIRVRRLV